MYKNLYLTSVHPPDYSQSYGDKIVYFFNSKKTMCIKFYDSAKCSPIVQYSITLTGKQLTWFFSIKHLGHIFDWCLSFSKDVVCEKDKYVVCIDNSVTEFGFAQCFTSF